MAGINYAFRMNQQLHGACKHCKKSVPIKSRDVKFRRVEANGCRSYWVNCPYCGKGF